MSGSRKILTVNRFQHRFQQYTVRFLRSLVTKREQALYRERYCCTQQNITVGAENGGVRTVTQRFPKTCPKHVGALLLVVAFSSVEKWCMGVWQHMGAVLVCVIVVRSDACESVLCCRHVCVRAFRHLLFTSKDLNADLSVALTSIIVVRGRQARPQRARVHHCSVGKHTCEDEHHEPLRRRGRRT